MNGVQILYLFSLNLPLFMGVSKFLLLITHYKHILYNKAMCFLLFFLWWIIIGSFIELWVFSFGFSGQRYAVQKCLYNFTYGLYIVVTHCHYKYFTFSHCHFILLVRINSLFYTNGAHRKYFLSLQNSHFLA